MPHPGQLVIERHLQLAQQQQAIVVLRQESWPHKSLGIQEINS